MEENKPHQLRQYVSSRSGHHHTFIRGHNREPIFYSSMTRMNDSDSVIHSHLCLVVYTVTNKLEQWRIQDFPDEGANSQSECANLLFSKFLPKTA